ncbi:MAG TPA: protein kinase, partial [Gemmataceae bacterium]|nr:protein kinase [Gemmataceae bacterium]
VLLAGPHADNEEMARFRKEAEAIARLQHPNIVHIYDIGQADGYAYLALEYAAGGTLADRLKGKPQTPRAAAQLIQTLARAIHVVHRKRIIHRDLKPANILLVSSGVVSNEWSGATLNDTRLTAHLPKITDFGLAKQIDGPSLTQTGVVMGTPSYMAPEQVEGKRNEIGPATDIYALGAILYEMLTGKPPFQGASSLETVRQVLDARPRPPSEIVAVPRHLERICLRCLEKDPRRRYATALELADDLGSFLSGHTIESAPTEIRKSKLGVAQVLVGIFALAACFALAYLIWILVVGGRNKGTELTSARDGNTNSMREILPSPNGGNKNDGGQPKPKEEQERAGPPRWEQLQIVRSQPDEKFHRIAFPTRQLGFVASNRAIYKTDDAGQTFKPVFQAGILQSGKIKFVRFQDARSGWLLSEGNLYATDDGGDTWLPAELDVHVRDLAIGPDGWILAGGLHSPFDQERLFSKRGPTAKWQNLDFAKRADVEGRIKSLAQVAIADPQTAVVASNDTFSPKCCVVRTSDGGQSWKTVFQTDKARISGMQFADSKRGWIVGGQSLWATDDGGDTWKPQLNPEQRSLDLLAFDPHGSSFGVILFNDRNYAKMLVTTDGKQWRTVDLETKGSIAGMAVVDGGCAMVLLEDGRIGRYLVPGFKP